MRKFIHGALDIEMASDPPAIKSSLRGGSPFQKEVEAGLRELLKTRELTTLEWCELTDVEFDSEEELYSYLHKLYDYLFRGSEEAPEIPD